MKKNQEILTLHELGETLLLPMTVEFKSNKLDYEVTVIKYYGIFELGFLVRQSYLPAKGNVSYP